MLHEMGMRLEVVILAMFEHEKATFLQKTLFKDKLGYGRDFF